MRVISTWCKKRGLGKTTKRIVWRSQAAREACNRTRSTSHSSCPLRAVVGAAQTRARQYRGYVWPLDDGREYLLAGASEVLRTNVLLDHGACHRGCLVQIIGASTVKAASCVSWHSGLSS